MKEIDKYMTPSEAADKWGVAPETVRDRLKLARYKDNLDHLLEEGLVKFYLKEGGKRKEWIITVDAMEYWFGDKK